VQCDQPKCTAVAEFYVSNITPGRVLALCERHMEQAWEIAHLLNASIKVEAMPKPAHGKS